MNAQTDAFLKAVRASVPGGMGQSAAHESAHLHVSGEATYTDDIAEAQGTLHAALGLSSQAHAKLLGMDLAAVRAMPGVVAVFTASDIPGANEVGPIVHDDPILADGVVQYVGQPVFLVVATSHDAARRAAAQAKHCVRYDALPAYITPQAAHEAGRHVIPAMTLRREATAPVAEAIAGAPHRLSGEFEVGGQEQFYLEGHISYALPKENQELHVFCSTQHPTEMQHTVAHALGWASHQVRLECRRMGGGFGGKESQSALFACAAAVAAVKLRRPVKLRVDRDDDFLVTGRRHCFWYRYDVGYDNDGRVLGAEVTMVSRAGFSADLSGPVMTRALCHFDNAYWLPNVSMAGHSAKTNTQSNTAFRGFGGPQGAIAVENILDSIARRLGKDALDVRRANYYASDPAQGQTTPYGQPLEDNVIHELTAELEARSGYRARRQAIAAFNAISPVLKKGLALTPVKFGISFNVAHFNQAGALVHVYTDGSVLVNHGGTEMGQGLNTKVAQVVAHELGIPLERVRSTATDTHKIANTSATAASTGSDLNGKAAQAAARTIKARLNEFAQGKYGANWQAVPFEQVVADAYVARVQLWSDGFYATPKIHWNRETMSGHPFFYFAYGAAVAEVLVDTLTGEWRCLRADVLHDAGQSLNPALDIGQVEGAFIQGMGWLTMEELVWHPLDGSPRAGMLMTHAPSTYKIPTANDTPEVFNVGLWGGGTDQPNREDTIGRSKAVGEPPLLLPFSVFYAIRDAISAVGSHRVDPPLDAPATSERILKAVAAVRSRGGH
jgi:xanthine dehydrogenase large subunit